MADLWLEWGDDFQVDATGDLLIADGDDEVRQRLERRLFTAVQGYVWHPDYGAGLPQKIGQFFRSLKFSPSWQANWLLRPRSPLLLPLY